MDIANVLAIVAICMGTIGLVSAYIFPHVNIIGDSMFPTFIDGERVKAVRMNRFMELEDGEVYVFECPYEKGRAVIKRLAWHDDSMCYFLGDNAEVSYDSREYGTIHRCSIIAKLLDSRRYFLDGEG